MTRGKQSFLGGAALLTVTMLVTKAIGALYKIPLGNLLDEQGMNYFYAAYNIYNLLLMLSTAGLPLALSRLVSQAEALGWVNRRRRIVSVAFWLFLLLGLLSSGLMFFLAGDLAGWMHNTRAEDAIRVLSPAVLCVCLVSVIRGYTQGMGDMRPTAASEVIESASKLVVGQGVYAIGNPLGELGGTVTSGIISALSREVTIDNQTMTLLQTSAALNNGNSGGPLINEYGQVIGINTLKMSTTDSTEATVEGLGFALPISSVSFVVNDLIANGHYRGAPSLGITVTTVEKDGGGTQVQVMEVSTGSGAADAGIQAGDVILAADGQAVSVTSDLLTARRSHIIGDTVTLTILRDGQQFDVEVTLRSNRSFG